jgi:hypothetical protein
VLSYKPAERSRCLAKQLEAGDVSNTKEWEPYNPARQDEVYLRKWSAASSMKGWTS